MTKKGNLGLLERSTDRSLSVEWTPIEDTGDIILSKLARLLVQAVNEHSNNGNGGKGNGNTG